jgi:hypothetical protein
MHTYLIMLNPGHSRVYYKQSTRLALAELMIACRRFENKCLDTELTTIADIPYLSFRVEKQLTSDESSILSRLSFIFALFELVETGKQISLLPIAFASTEHVDPMISHLLKYSGKTNELFTKMMINIALLSSDYDYDQNIQLLDPVSGKGTTLFEGAVYGYDVAGIEVNKKPVHEACVFFRKFLEEGKFKHRLSKTGGPRKNRSESYEIQEFQYARNKEEFKSERSRRKLKFVRGDTASAGRYFGKSSFHIIVGDLPYGIAHGNMPRDKQLSPSRSPLSLLSDCLPQWYKVLKKSGVMVLSWNRFVMSRDDLAQILADNGFHVLSEDPYNDFEHRVNQSIKRDLVVARK